MTLTRLQLTALTIAAIGCMVLGEISGPVWWIGLLAAVGGVCLAGVE